MIADTGMELNLARLLTSGAVDIDGILEAAAEVDSGRSPGLCQALVDLDYALPSQFAPSGPTVERVHAIPGGGSITVAEAEAPPEDEP
jgi:hypothetical protein